MTANDGSDWSVCTTWVDDGGDYHLIDAYRVRLSFPAVKKAVASRQLQFGAQTVLIEDVGIGTGLIQQLRSEGDVRPIGIAPQGSKADRMVAQSSKIEAGRVHLPRSAPWRQEFMAEMMAFPHGRHDDQVDSVSQYLGWISKRAGIPHGLSAAPAGRPRCEMGPAGKRRSAHGGLQGRARRVQRRVKPRQRSAFAQVPPLPPTRASREIQAPHTSTNPLLMAFATTNHDHDACKVVWCVIEKVIITPGLREHREQSATLCVVRAEAQFGVIN